jgi:hypothetical protein
MFVASNLDIFTFGVCDFYAKDILIFIYLLKVALNVRDKLIIHLILVFINNMRHEVSRVSGFVLKHIIELDDIFFLTRNHKTCSLIFLLLWILELWFSSCNLILAAFFRVTALSFLLIHNNLRFFNYSSFELPDLPILNCDILLSP